LGRDVLVALVCEEDLSPNLARRILCGVNVHVGVPVLDSIDQSGQRLALQRSHKVSSGDRAHGNRTVTPARKESSMQEEGHRRTIMGRISKVNMGNHNVLNVRNVQSER